MHYIILFLYCVLSAFAYGYVFKKPFAGSIAPAFFLHILLCIFTAVFFGSVSFGIRGGVAACVIIAVKAVIYDLKRLRDKNENLHHAGIKKALSMLPASDFFKSLNSTAFLAFALIFILIIFINTGKCFTQWDEFSHWGMFIKETLRLDRLYCTSPKDFPHKDYLPSVTMFISICSKLSFKYSEADAYRAIQLLQFSMILPIIQKGNTGEPVIIISDKHKKLNYAEIIKSLLIVALVIITLLYILPMDGMNSFHTVYQDVIYAFFLFYCMYAAYISSGDYKYDAFLLTLSLTMLSLVKMTAVFFVPFVLGLYFVKNCMENKRIKLRTSIICTLICGIIPLAVWKILNVYVQKFVKDAGIQSYGNVRPSALFDVLLHNGVISFQDRLDDNLRRILSEQFYGTLSIKKLSVLLLFITFIFAFIYADRIKLLLLDLWILLTGAAYAFLIYFLYCTQFSEHEAVEIAGFPRYFVSFVYAVILFLIYIGANTEIKLLNAGRLKDKAQTAAVSAVVFVLSIALFITLPDRFTRLLPGFLTGDDVFYEERMKSAEPILANTDASIDERIFCIISDSDYGRFFRLRYDTNPRTVDGGIIGGSRSDDTGFEWNWDLKPDELVNEVAKYEYIYFESVDDMFINEYSEAFAEPALIKAGCIYKVKLSGSRIELIKF